MSGLKVTTRPGLRVYRGAPKPPLKDGACPHCFRVIKLTARLRRREHIDPTTGARCTGSGITVGESTDFEIGDLPPPLRVPDRPVDTHGSVNIQRTRYVIADDGSFLPYAGGSDREAANGRAACSSCGRHIPLNTDGSIRRHRVRHQDPLAPYCEAAS